SVAASAGADRPPPRRPHPAGRGAMALGHPRRAYDAGMAPGRIRRILSRAPMSAWTVRTRVLSLMLASMASALAVTDVLTYAIQFCALEWRVDRELWQESSELALIANSEDAGGALRYTTRDELMLRVTESAAPSDDESVLAIIDGTGRYEAQV